MFICEKTGARQVHWPSMADGVVTISVAQMSYLLSGIDWRHPQETGVPKRRIKL